MNQADVYQVKSNMINVQPNAEQLAEISQLIIEGKIKTKVDQVFPLEETKEAQMLTKAGQVRGKIVINI